MNDKKSIEEQDQNKESGENENDGKDSNKNDAAEDNKNDSNAEVYLFLNSLNFYYWFIYNNFLK